MKLKICFLLLLWPIFRLAAQDNIIAHGLQPGEIVPDVAFNITNYRSPVAKLSDFRGRLIILDFWATWCSPCRAMLPKADSLNHAFKNKALILPVTYESETKAGPVMASVRAKAVVNEPEVFADHALHELFPHQTLPHYVWIDAKGMVVGITDSRSVNALGISDALHGKYPSALKQDIYRPYDMRKPLLADGNGGDAADIKYHSLLTGFIPGLTPGAAITPYDTLRGQQFTARNEPLLLLLRMAYGNDGRYFMPAQFVIRSRDSLDLRTKLSGQSYLDWLKAGNGYCYELVLPPSLRGQAYTIMQSDMQHMFPQYRMRVEARDSACLALVRVGQKELLYTKGGTPKAEISAYSCSMVNCPLSQLLMRLSHQYLQNSPYPIVDETGYTGRVDLDFKAYLSNVSELNAGLERYGLQLVKKRARAQYLVIEDNPDYKTKP